MISVSEILPFQAVNLPITVKASDRVTGMAEFQNVRI
jgi:hypothetical protein